MAVIATDTKTLSVTVDVESAVTWYRLQASTATPPTRPTSASPDGWATTEPAYDGTATNTLYACVKTTLSDGSFSWSEVSVSSSYEAAKQAWNKAAAAEGAAEGAARTATEATESVTAAQGELSALSQSVAALDALVRYVGAEVDDGGEVLVPAGLRVCPAGEEGGYFLVLATDGLYVYDGESSLVARLGESIEFSASRPQYIGGEDAYIKFYDSDDSGTPDAISVAGTNLELLMGQVAVPLENVSGLAERLEAVLDQAARDAASGRTVQEDDGEGGTATTTYGPFATRDELADAQGSLSAATDELSESVSDLSERADEADERAAEADEWRSGRFFGSTMTGMRAPGSDAASFRAYADQAAIFAGGQRQLMATGEGVEVTGLSAADVAVAGDFTIANDWALVERDNENLALKWIG